MNAMAQHRMPPSRQPGPTKSGTGRRMVGRPARRILSVALLVAFPAVAAAVDVTYEIGGSAWYSDNIALVDREPESETVVSTELTFRAQQVGSSIELVALGDLAYVDYLGNTFEPELRGQVLGHLQWTLLPNRIQFLVEDAFTYQPINALSRFTPDNRQYVNVFVAGPSFFIHPGQATIGRLDLRYQNNRAEKNTAFNGHYLSAAARLIRDIDANTRVSLNAVAISNQFDENDQIQDYRRRDAYISYARTLSDTRWSAELGYSWLELDDGTSESGLLARASLDWRIAPHSNLGVRLGYEYSDAASALITRIGTLAAPSADPRGIAEPIFPGILDAGEFANAGTVITADPMLRQRLEVDYRFTNKRLSFTVSPYYEHYDYISDPTLDHEVQGLRISGSYRLRTDLTVTGWLEQVDREYDTRNRKDRDGIAKVSLVKQFTRQWSGQLDLKYRTRESNITGASYDENVIGVSVTYRR